MNSSESYIMEPGEIRSKKNEVQEAYFSPNKTVSPAPNMNLIQ